LSEASKKEEGCIGYDLSQNQESEEQFLIWEIWRSEEDLIKH